MSDEPAFVPPRFQRPEELDPPRIGADGRRDFADVEFAMPLGFRPLRLELTVPAGDGPVPVVLFVHGGAFMFGSRLHSAVEHPLWEELLARGLALARVEYRLSGEARFPACLGDVLAAVRWLRAFGAGLGLRTDRIGVIGESAGGHLAAFVGLNPTDAALVGEEGVTGVDSSVQAAVAWYPPTAFDLMDEDAGPDAVMPHDTADSPESLLVGATVGEHRELARAASPLGHVGPGSAPMLLVHGLADRVVPFRQSERLRDAVAAAGGEVELDLVPGADHVFRGVDLAPIAARSADFLAERLR